MDGQLDAVDGRWRLRFVRALPHSRQKVWQAITEPEHLEAWFPTEIVGERAKGAPLTFSFRHGEGPDLKGEILEYDPPALLEMRWGDETLRFELAGDGEQCQLTFVNTFDELGKAARDAAGWHVCLEDLRHDLDGTTAEGSPESRWREVHARYVAAFGPEAATQGPPDPFPA